MKNLQIGDNDLLGQAFNGHNLHLLLNQKGIDSYHLIANEPNSDDNKTFQIGNQYSWLLRQKMTMAEEYYSLSAAFYNSTYDIIYHHLFLDADVVHFHLINNKMFDINLLPLISRLKPIIWTLHDPWAISGHCIHHFDCNNWQNGCGNCPYLDIPNKINFDNTALTWEMKRLAFQNSDLNIIVASQWMFDLVKKSPFFSHCSVDIVPFGVDDNIFKPANFLETKELRKKFDISSDDIVLMFRIDDNIFKGGDLLKEIIPHLKYSKPITLITVGSRGLINQYKNIVKIKEFGWVNDKNLMSQLYQISDIFLMPSRQESFGLMAIEAMSCKKPVIILKGTALSSITSAPDIGYECEGNPKSLLDATQYLIDNKKEREYRAELSYQLAKKRYKQEDYVNKIIEIYYQAINNHKSKSNNKSIIDGLKNQLNHKKQDNNRNILDKKEPIIINHNLYFFKYIKIGKLVIKHYKSHSTISIWGITLLKYKISSINQRIYYFLSIPVLKVKEKAIFSNK